MGIFKKIGRVIIRSICRVLAIVIYRVKIIGIENVPKDKACIVCGNHVHALDAPVLIATTNRKIRFMAKEELWKNAGFRIMAYCYDVFPVKRGKNDTDAVKTSLKILKNNQILGIYPEGTRNGLAKKVKLKNGAVNLAIRSGAVIVPFAVKGNFKPFRKITYIFGKPMDFSDYREQLKNKEVLDQLTNNVMEKIIELRDN